MVIREVNGDSLLRRLNENPDQFKRYITPILEEAAAN